MEGTEEVSVTEEPLDASSLELEAAQTSNETQNEEDGGEVSVEDDGREAVLEQSGDDLQTSQEEGAEGGDDLQTSQEEGAEGGDDLQTSQEEGAEGEVILKEGAEGEVILNHDGGDEQDAGQQPLIHGTESGLDGSEIIDENATADIQPPVEEEPAHASEEEMPNNAEEMETNNEEYSANHDAQQLTEAESEVWNGDGGQGLGQDDMNMQAMSDEGDVFKSSYLSAASRLDVQPIQALVDNLDIWIETGEPLSSVELKGNSRQLYNRRLADKDVEAIIMALEACAHVEVSALDFSWNNITDQGCMVLAEFLKTNRNVTRLHLAYNDIGEEGVKALAAVLRTNTTLKHLVLNGNKVGDMGGLALAHMLCVNSSLRTAELGNMELGHQTLTMLGVALAKNRSLAVLNIDRPLLFSCQEEAIQHIAMGLRSNNCLRTMSLKNAGLRDKGCYLLCDNLVLNHSLTELDISSNKLTEDAGPHLAKLIKNNSNISSLYLANNELCDRGCTSLSEALAANSGLTDLDVAYNRIDNDGLLQLAHAVPKHGLLSRLRAWGNMIKPQSTAALVYACQQLKSLKNCDILVQIIDDVPYAVRKITTSSTYEPGLV